MCAWNGVIVTFSLLSLLLTQFSATCSVVGPANCHYSCTAFCAAS